MIPAHMSNLYTWRALSFTEEHGRPVHAAMLALEYEEWPALVTKTGEQHNLKRPRFCAAPMRVAAPG